MSDAQQQDQTDIHTSLRQRQLLSVNLHPDGYLDIYYREPSHRQTSSNPPQPVPDRVYIERYIGGMHGNVELHTVIEGQHTPGFFTPESFTFDLKPGLPGDTK